MIIFRRSSPRGHVYHVARASERFPLFVHELVSEARGQGLPLAMVERRPGESGVLAVGPLGEEEDRRFRARWAAFIAD